MSLGFVWMEMIFSIKARLLEGVGLRGYCLKRVGFAKEHANFLVNLGGAEFEEALDLIELAKTRVLQECGIHLEE